MFNSSNINFLIGLVGIIYINNNMSVNSSDIDHPISIQSDQVISV